MYFHIASHSQECPGKVYNPKAKAYVEKLPFTRTFSHEFVHAYRDPLSMGFWPILTFMMGIMAWLCSTLANRSRLRSDVCFSLMTMR